MKTLKKMYIEDQIKVLIDAKLTWMRYNGFFKFIKLELSIKNGLDKIIDEAKAIADKKINEIPA